MTHHLFYQVPLQYSEPDGEQAAVAIIMSPSNFSAGDENYLGPVLFNPGGPGDSGTSFLLSEVTLFREVLGPGYDLVGFDPRGMYQQLANIKEIEV